MRLKWISKIGIIAAASVAAGCQLEHLRPTVELTEDLDEATRSDTAKVIMAEPCGEAFTQPRGWDGHAAYMANGTVRHLPAYFEDPFEDKGSQDGRYEITWEDWLAWPYGEGRWQFANMAFIPLSLAVEYPWLIKYSDGRVGTRRWREHDASRSPAPDADGAPVEWGGYSQNQR